MLLAKHGKFKHVSVFVPTELELEDALARKQKYMGLAAKMIAGNPLKQTRELLQELNQYVINLEPG